MTNTIQIGRRLVPVEHVALIEPFEPSDQSKLQSERPFQTRVVLIDRDSVLTEEPLDAFAERLGFRMLADDHVATNSAVHFSVEAFAAAERFTPTKPYRTRLLWRDHDGQPQSKLLLTEPEKVLAIVVRAQVDEPAPASIQRTQRRSRKRRAEAAPAPE